MFGGQCPLGIHALLPFDKTYVAVVLRVALWQIGPAADASRNNLLVDASARENVSASSEGAQALAASKHHSPAPHGMPVPKCWSPPASATMGTLSRRRGSGSFPSNCLAAAAIPSMTLQPSTA